MPDLNLPPPLENANNKEALAKALEEIRNLKAAKAAKLNAELASIRAMREQQVDKAMRQSARTRALQFPGTTVEDILATPQYAPLREPEASTPESMLSALKSESPTTTTPITDDRQEAYVAAKRANRKLTPDEFEARYAQNARNYSVYYRLARHMLKAGPKEMQGLQQMLGNVIPKQDRPLFDSIVADIAQAPELSTDKAGTFGRIGLALGEGATDILARAPQNLALSVNPLTSDETRTEQEYKQHLNDLRIGYGVNRPQGFVEKFTLGGLGLGVKLAIPGGLLAKAGQFGAEGASQGYDRYREMGFTPNEARAAGTIEGAATGALSALKFDRLIPPAARTVIANTVKQAATNYAKRFAEGTALQAIQTAVSEAVLSSAKYATENLRDDAKLEVPALKERLWNDLESFAVAVGHNALLAVGPTMLDANNISLRKATMAQAAVNRAQISMEATARERANIPAERTARRLVEHFPPRAAQAHRDAVTMFDKTAILTESDKVSGSSELIRQHPDIAVQVAQSDPSRKAMGELIPGANKWPKAERERLVDTLRSRLGHLDPTLKVPPPTPPKPQEVADSPEPHTLTIDNFTTSKDPVLAAKREAELVRIMEGERIESIRRRNAGETPAPDWFSLPEVLVNKAHRAIVERALLRGQTVPPEVLAAHPGLAAAHGYDVRTVFDAARSQRTTERLERREATAEQLGMEAKRSAEAAAYEARVKTARGSRAAKEAFEAIPTATPEEAETARLNNLDWKELKNEAKVAKIKVSGGRTKVVEAIVEQKKESGALAPLPGTNVKSTHARILPAFNLQSLAFGKGAGKAVRFAKYWGNRGGNIPRDLWDEWGKARGYGMRLTEEAGHVGRDFNRAVEQLYGESFKKPFGDADRPNIFSAKTEKLATGRQTVIPDSMVYKINQVLHGEEPSSILPKPLQGPTDNMRNMIDRNSDLLNRSGATRGKLMATIDANKGIYVHRSYEIFSNPKNYPDKVINEFPEVVKAMEDMVETQSVLLGTGLTREQITGKVRELLYQVRDKEVRDMGGFIKLVNEGGLKKELGPFMQRKELPLAYRRLLGEHTDPRVQFLSTVAGQAQILSRQMFLENFIRIGAGKYIRPPEGNGPHSGPALLPEGDFRVKIASEGNKALEPINGWYTTPEMKEALDEVFTYVPPGWLTQKFANVLHFTEGNVTFQNPSTQSRNATSNIYWAMANGWLNPITTAKAIRAEAAHLGLKDNAAQRALLLTLREQRLIGAGVEEGNLRALLDASQNEGSLMRFYKRLTKPLTAIYHGVDDTLKITGFLHTKNSLRKAMPHLSEQELNDMAGQRVRDKTATHENLPPGIINLRKRYPFLGKFASWPLSQMRAAYKTLEYAARDAADPRPAVRAMGLRSLLYAGAAYSGALGGASWLASSLLGFNSKDRADLAELSQGYLQDHDLVPIGRDKDGNIQFVDGTYTNPLSPFMAIYKAFARGETMKESMTNAAHSFFDPILGPSILTDKLVELYTNMTDYGPVYNEQDAPDKQREAVAKHLQSIFVPGWARTIEQLKTAGSMDPRTGLTKSTNEVIASNFLGFRVQTANTAQALSSKAAQRLADFSEAAKIQNDAIKTRGPIADADLLAATDRRIDADHRIFDKLRKHYTAATNQNVSLKDAAAILKATGASERIIEAVAQGRFRPYIPSDKYAAKQEELAELDALPGVPPAEYARRRFLIQQHTYNRWLKEDPTAATEWRETLLNAAANTALSPANTPAEKDAQAHALLTLHNWTPTITRQELITRRNTHKRTKQLERIAKQKEAQQERLQAAERN